MDNTVHDTFSTGRPTYDEVFNAWGEERIFERQIFLYKFCERLTEYHKIRNDVCIPADLINEVVLNYFTDIYRYKNFHRIDRINTIKIAAYTVFWFLRIRPIQISDNCQKLNAMHRQINQYAAYNLMHYILFDLNTMINNPNRANINFTDHCIYTFNYRIFTPQSIELALLGLLADPYHPPKKEFSLKE